MRSRVSGTLVLDTGCWRGQNRPRSGAGAGDRGPPGLTASEQPVLTGEPPSHTDPGTREPAHVGEAGQLAAELSKAQSHTNNLAGKISELLGQSTLSRDVFSNLYGDGELCNRAGKNTQAARKKEARSRSRQEAEEVKLQQPRVTFSPNRTRKPGRCGTAQGWRGAGKKGRGPGAGGTGRLPAPPQGPEATTDRESPFRDAGPQLTASPTDRGPWAQPRRRPGKGPAITPQAGQGPRLAWTQQMALPAGQEGASHTCPAVPRVNKDNSTRFSKPGKARVRPFLGQVRPSSST